MLTALLLAGALAAPAVPGPGLAALRIDARHPAPVVDGRLDDAVWAAADSVGGFTQREPAEGQPSRYPTVVRAAIDNGALYVAVRAYDPAPGRIMAQLTRRDEDSPSDWLILAIDSHHDRRSAYAFAVNPAGVKRDFLIADGADDDDSWDAVWESAVRTDERGWTAEYRIPLSALRFTTGGEGVWGFQVLRMVQRDRELSSWTPLKRDEPRSVARFGELRGLDGIRPPRRLEVLPYSVSRLTHASADRRDPFHGTNAFGGATGADLKYGVTSNLTLDATVNPDFGQVEADPSQVNLSAYETYLPEKRPFFTEGADIFRFGIALGDGDDANEQLFYSRRIGRTPQGDATGRGGFEAVPDRTTILGAAKLSGRTDGGWSVGLLDAVTGEERAQVSDSTGRRYADAVEPMTNYAMARVRRDLNEGRTRIGAVATSVYRRLDGTGMTWLRDGAVAGGLDFSHRWAGDAWLASGWLLGSNVRGSAESITETQRASARYYQRPDAGYVRLDTTATSLSGWGANAVLSKVKGTVQGGLLGQVRSPGLELNDMGYQRDADQVMAAGFLSLRQFKPGHGIRNGRVNFNLWQQRDFGGDVLGVGGNVNGSANLMSYWNLYGGVEHDDAGLSIRALRGGGLMRTPASWSAWGGVSSDSRRKLTLGGGGSAGAEPDAGGPSWSAFVDADWRVRAGTRLSLSPSFSADHGGWQYVDQVDDGGGQRHFVFADLRQKTASVSIRLNQTFTPQLSLQLYAQPFLSAGSYSGFKEVRDPLARGYGERFRAFGAGELARCDGTYTVDGGACGAGAAPAGAYSFGDPAFNVRDLNVNAVVRWEYRLGSALFFAWSHSRTGDAGPESPFRLRDDFHALWQEKATNVFLIKANWWLHL